MKNAIHLSSNLLIQCKRDAINAMLKRFEVLIRSTDGVLSGNIIWRKILYSLGIEEEVSTRDAAEALAKVYAKLNSLQEKAGVKIEATITTDGINIESPNENIVHHITIPKRELTESVDITIPIENTLDTVIKKIID